MGSPFPTSISKVGEGHIVVSPLPSGGNGLETITYQYPLKLISPTPSVHQKSVLVFLLSYGGGLVGGDHINLDVDVRAAALLSVVTQGHTKIFKSASPDIVTSQNLNVRIQDDASLCLLPDPVQPFADSVYIQKQIFTVTPTSTLCFLDWVTQGRTARGENWSFVSWKGCNEVWLAGHSPDAKPRLLVRDTVLLSSPDSVVLGRSLRDAMHQMAVFGTLILRGPKVQRLADFFTTEFAALPRLGARDFRTIEDQAKEDSQLSELERWRARRIRMEREQGILWSAAQVRSCVIVKLGARTVEGGREWVGAMLSKEGSVEEHFGEEALMCVK
ncbi:Urease accessory protein-like protein [Emericellopsis cladophorae]|uniref:Urease accessory protein-like protein n=1 Tax=Emericellopsis cladophorae TaxID=2686198 RepID=A0A9Q0BEY3_9HYPO|nr:Urease accessory protein-like protein [Emericellopsis cladophorae]KAI6782917.1 Urease accessory protein-like protein [Emericellopsis cladophorae]